MTKGQVFEEPSTSATLAWPERYAQLLAAHTHLQETLSTHEAAHRRALTVVKYEPSLPNNDVFTKDLLAQNHELQRHCRALELRLAKLNGAEASTTVPRDRTRRKGMNSNAASLRQVKVVDCQTQTIDSLDDRHEAPARQHANEPTQLDSDANKNGSNQVHELVSLLKQRLDDLDVDLVRLQQENELLRAERDQMGTATSGTNDGEALWTYVQQQELQHLLADRMRQMTILEEQFALLQAKVKTKTMLYQESLDKIEQLTTELFDAKQTLLKQAEWLHAQEDTNAQLQLLEKEVHLLRKENSVLNETVSVLSARPLDSLNIQLEKKALEISLLEDKNTHLETDIKMASQDHRVVMQTNDKLRRWIDALTHQLDGSLQQNATLQAEIERLIGERELAQMQLQFYLSGDSTESKELMEAVGRALKSMRTADDDSLKSEALADASRLPKEQKAAEESALQNERAEKMAHVTKLIQEETQAQLQEMKHVHQAEVRELKRQCASWQQRANDYLQEITALRYPDGASTVSKDKVLSSSREKRWSSTGQSIGRSLSTSHVEENLMEVRLCDLRSSVSTRIVESCSFVLFCDFYDFESQHSPVFMLDTADPTAVAPVEMEVSYKLVVDHAFCHSPVAQTLSVELHQLQLASSSVVGVVDVSLQSLWMSERGYMALSVKLLDPASQVAVGTIRIAISLACPVDHLSRVWNQKSLTYRRPTARVESSGLLTSSVQLGIQVISIVLTKEMATTTRDAHAKVRYRFMGNPTVRYSSQNTPITSFGFSVFNVDRSRAFEIPSDDQFVGFLEHHEMMVTVESPDGMQGQGVVAFRPIITGLRANQCCSSIVSVIISTTDHPNQVEQQPSGQVLGRVWLELRAYDLKSIEPIQAAEMRDTVTRVFGSEDGSRIDWQRFCEIMELSVADRAVRQLLFEKLQVNKFTKRAVMTTIKDIAVVGMANIPAVFERTGLQCSRSELSFVSATLSACDMDTLHNDEPDVLRRSQAKQLQRLMLLVETLDTDWLRLEPLVRTHVETLNVLATYPNSGSEGIPWDSFVHRIRLIT